MTEKPPGRDRAPAAKGWWTLGLCLLLGLVTAAVYWPVLHHAFIVYDDGQYIEQNPQVLAGLSWAGVRWAFTSAYASNWHPLTWLSHMLDVQLFGLNAGGHHLTNLLLHTLNSVLLLLALKRLTGSLGRSAFVAALFALHPAHVESVAWAAERKDVLSGCFFMLTLLAYAEYAARREDGGERMEKGKERAEAQRSTFNVQAPTLKVLGGSAVWYGLALVFFALGLMSKPMLVTLPCVLLLLDYWPLGRFGPADGRWQRANGQSQIAKDQGQTANGPGPRGRAQTARLLLEKLPFLALCLASCVVTFIAQRAGGAVASLEMVNYEQRMGNALMAYLLYLVKLIWPSKLALMYLAPTPWPVEQLALAVVVLGMLTALAWKRRRTQPYFAVGWAWYLGMLVPVIGLVQVGNQFMADRYTYLPSIGVFILLSWALAGGQSRIEQRTAKIRWLLPAGALTCLAVLALAARDQVDCWQNSETVFTHCLEATGRNSIAHDNLGVALAKQERFEEAKSHFLAALEIKPGDADVLHNLGVALMQQGDFEAGMNYLRQAASVKPEFIVGYPKLAAVLDAKGKTAGAAACYREYLRAEPDGLEACNNLAWILATHPDAGLRDGKAAVRLAEHACELSRYQQAVCIGTLAAAYAEAGRFPDAVRAAEQAVAVADAAGQTELAERNRQLLEQYRAGKPYRDTGN